jgi:glucan phosphoethanolaminetransferase (alkaline phosphatase superfamily)
MNVEKAINKETILVAICIFILLAPNFIVVIEASDLRVAEFSEAIAYAVVFWGIWFALCKKAWLAIMLASLPAFWWAASLFVRIKYQVPITQTFLSMVLNTPIREVFDFSLSYGWYWLVAAVLIPVTLFSLSFYFIKYPITWNHYSRYLVITLGSTVLLLMYVIIDSTYSYQKIFLSGQKEDPFLGDKPNLWFDRLGSVYPLDFPIAAWRVYKNTQKTQSLRSMLPPMRVEKNLESLDRPDIVILVLGESSRLDHWSLFGYSRPTTPLLQSQSGILKFNNVVTQSITTRVAVPSIISRQPFLLADGASKKDIEPSILKAFEQVGYETYWLSNQSSSGFFENPIAFYAADAQYQSQLNSSSYSALGTYDEIVLDKTKDILLKKRLPAIIIIHTMGSHFNYAHRYPPKFDIFKPSFNPRDNIRDLIKNNSQGAELERIKNSYDNSILYTDFILSSLINLLRESSENSFLIYISDHAEDIGDDTTCSYTDIGRRSSGSFRVPMLLWLGSEYVNKHTVITNQLTDQMQKPHISTVLPQTLLDMALINVIGQRSSSLLDSASNGSRQVFSAQGGWIDFDKAEKNNKCDIGLFK